MMIGNRVIIPTKRSKFPHFLLFTISQATGLLKKTEGVVNLTVCNPNQSKLAKEEEERAKGGDPATNGVETAGEWIPPNKKRKKNIDHPLSFFLSSDTQWMIE